MYNTCMFELSVYHYDGSIKLFNYMQLINIYKLKLIININLLYQKYS
jgi:hypothetical protein